MRGRSIVEAVAVFAAIAAVQYLAPGVAQLARWETRALGESYFLGLLTAAVPLLALVASKGSLEDYGLIVSDWRASLSRGLIGYLYLLLPNLVLFLMTVTLASVTYLPVSLFVSGVTFFAMFLALGHLSLGGSPRTRRDLALIAILLGAPLIISAVFGSLTFRLASAVVWELVFGGVAQEVLYRGYVQSRVNEEYGRPWSYMGVVFGPGLLVSSGLYGLAGAMSGFRPWSDLYALSLPVGIHGLALGLFLGFLREATGDIGASSVANGLRGAVGRLLMRAVV
ncbi:MAG: CPBP family glutamic-type intramembrane protease [Candidatus Bathyarchaeota archaeon]